GDCVCDHFGDSGGGFVEGERGERYGDRGGRGDFESVGGERYGEQGGGFAGGDLPGADGGWVVHGCFAGVEGCGDRGDGRRGGGSAFDAGVERVDGCEADRSMEVAVSGGQQAIDAAG